MIGTIAMAVNIAKFPRLSLRNLRIIAAPLPAQCNDAGSHSSLNSTFWNQVETVRSYSCGIYHCEWSKGERWDQRQNPLGSHLAVKHCACALLFNLDEWQKSMPLDPSGGDGL